jgi:hypothetical protein
MSPNDNTSDGAADLPELPDALPPLPADVALPDLTPLFENGLEEIGRIENGVLMRPQEQPIHVGVAGPAIVYPKWRVNTDLDKTVLVIDSNYATSQWLEVCLPTATLLELLERAAAQHPVAGASILSLLYSVRECFKCK